MGSFNFRKHGLPHLIAIGVFFGICIAYFMPVLEGKVLPTHDIKQHKGMSREILEFRENTGKVSLWTNSMFGGMPTYQIAAPYPSSLFLVKPIQRLMTRGLPRPMNMLMLYFLGFYLLMLSFKVDWRLALAGALAYGFASYNIIIIDAGHNTKALAIGLAPMVFAAINMTLRSKYWLLGAALTGLAMGFEIKVNHIQIAYYLMFIIAAMGISWLVEKIKNGETVDAAKRAGAVLVAVLLGIGTNAGHILTTAEYSKETTRGTSNIKSPDGSQRKGLRKEYITHWSYGVAETGTLLIPNFHGGGIQNGMDFSDLEIFDVLKAQLGKKTAQQYAMSMLYWGNQPGTNGPVYLGALICFLFVFGFMVTNNYTRIWILSVSLLAIALSWGSNFKSLTYFFIDYFPGYNKFRVVTMILTVVQITFPLLAILGLSKVFENKLEKKQIINALKWSVGITGGIALLFVLFPGVFFDFTSNADYDQYKNQENILDLLVEGRISLMRADAIRSLIFILLGAGTIFLYTSGTLKKNVAYIIMIAAIGLDLWMVAGRFLGPDKFQKPRNNEAAAVATKADKQIMADPDIHYRVLNFTVSTFNDATTSAFHKSLGGYHGAKLKRIQELIENRISTEIQQVRQSGYRNPTVSPVVNMFNTKYFIEPTKQGPQPIRNEGAMGNAWFVPKVQVVEDANAEMEALASFDPSQVAYTTPEFESLVSGVNGKPSGNIELVTYEPNRLVYECNIDQEGFAVFSEVFYRGNKDWVSTINGEKVDHARVNYLLRGMKIPAGKSTIEFKFEPKTYHAGETYSLISSLLLVLALLGGAFLTYRDQKKSTPTGDA